MNLHRTTYWTILVGAALWCSGLIAAPFLVSHVGSPAAFGQWIYSFFHTVCHQLDGRSLHVFGEPLAVCSRCASIYFAFLVGTFLYAFLRSVERPAVPSRTWLMVAVTPMVLDVLAGLLGIHEATIITRASTGTLFGVLMPFIIIPAASEAVQQLHRSSFYDVRKGVSNV